MFDRLEPRCMLAADAWPAVAAIDLIESPAFDASSVAWRVTFTESVTGVDPSDFALALDGVKAQALLTVAGSGATYTVTAPRVAGSGTIGLNLADDGSIQDAGGNPLRRQGMVVTLAPQASYAAGIYPDSLAVGDFNGDGKPDLVASNMYGSVVSVFLGKGDGTFQSQQKFTVGVLTDSVAVGDVNGDGKADIVVANHYDDNVGVLLGNGDGTFGAQQTFATGSRPGAVALGDFNDDGKLDIAATTEAADAVSVLLGKGDGTFAAQQAFATGWGPRALAVGDLDGDGVLDLAIANANDNTLGVLLGKGDGSFGAQQTFATGGTPSEVAIGDLDGDGTPDLVSANIIGNTVGVFLGKGDGTFEPQRAFAVSRPGGVAIGDLTMDGTLDIVCTNTDTDSVSVLVGVGDGTFGSPQPFAVGDVPTAVVVGDMNGDRKPDVICVNAFGNSASVLLNSQSGGFAGAVATIRQVFPGVESITFVGSAPTDSPTMAWRVTFSEPVTGVTGDDFALALTGVTASPRLSVSGSGATYTVTAARVAGLGTIGLNLVDDGTIRDLAGNPLVPDVPAAALTGLTPVRAGVDPRTLAVGDLDGDGILDIAVANLAINYSFKQVTILFGNGDGTFRPLASASVDSRPVAVAIGDLNVDGHADIVSTGGSDGTAGVLAGNGQGGFHALRPAATGENPSSLAIGDVNGDGRLDLVVPNYTDETVSILLGRGDGTFETQRTASVGTDPSSIALGDVNGDGKPDLVCSNLSDNTVSVLLGKGDGTFGLQQTFAVGNLPSSVALGDVNGDGRLDLAVANLTSNSVSVLLGMGDGTFQPQQTVATGVFPQGVTLGDINGDGRLDLVVANSEDDTVGVLVGKGDGTFEPQQTFATGDSPLAAAIADLNGDGRADVVAIDYSSYTASVLLNAARGNFTGEVAAHLWQARTPAFGSPTRTQTSFTVGITNYDPAFTWSVAVTAGGGEATLSGTGVITVTGLAPGAETKLRVTTARSGHGDGASTVTVRTLRAPHVPTFRTPVPAADGFSTQITNYDHRFTWTATAPGGGRVQISSVGVITVTGVSPGTLVAVTITATRAGYAPGSSVVEATTLQPAVIPVVGPVTRSRFSASFQIVNFDPAYSWTVGASHRASASISRTGRVTVFGIPSAESLVTLITSTRAGHATGSVGIRVPAFSAART